MEYGVTPLHFALYYRLSDNAINALVAAGADVSNVSNVHGERLLYISQSATDMVMLLIYL